MKKFHIALGVADIKQSVTDYTKRLGQEPNVVIEGEYALWRTETLNFSIRKTTNSEIGKLRHMGWEDDNAVGFTSEKDVNGVVWEYFNVQEQEKEIRETWPEVGNFKKMKAFKV